MPTVYSYHQVTKIFTQASEALESPNEEGVWLLPAFATFLEPPVAPDGQTVMWDGTAWTVVTITPAQLTEVVYGWLATDEEKHDILMQLANDFMDNVAKAFGFAGIADASSMASGDQTTQYGRDAAALRDWRAKVMDIILPVIASVQGNTNPMPPVADIRNSFPVFKRVFAPMPPPFVAAE